MRLYEFRCKECGEKFSFYSRLPELVREIRCPKCGGETEQTYASPEPCAARNDTYSSSGST
jgi:putative FmdB family regulatory protein